MQYVWEAIVLMFQWDVLLLCMGGGILGIILGAIPGLNGGLGVILLLPLTFSMEPTTAFALLVSLHTGGMSSGYIGSILLGIPGTNSSVATVFDGYEFTKQGDPVRALGAAAIASCIGTIPGVIFAMVLCAILGPIVVHLSPTELFAFTCTGIVMVTSLAEGNMVKGLIGAGLGIVVACVGAAPINATMRFTFGSYHLYKGFERVNVVLGVFAGRTIFLEYIKASRMKNNGPEIKLTGFKFHKEDFVGAFGNIFRSFFIGLWIGFLPGLGGSLANVMAYGTQKKFSRHPETFGTGNIEGVIAPEVANNASIGGAYIPMITLGIPGDGTTAYLLVGLMMAGIDPGPLLMQSEPTLVYMIFVATIFCAVFCLLAQLFGMKLFPAILRAPYQYLYPAIMALCFTGAYVVVTSISAIVILIGFTLVGIWFTYANIPTVPFVLSFILAEIMEQNLRSAVIMFPKYGVFCLFMRPISCALMLLIIFLLCWPAIKAIREKTRGKKVTIAQGTDIEE